MTLSPPLRPDDASVRRTDRRSTGLFRAFWRWHFYASFLVAPILVMFAVTGLIYLFRFQLEPMLNPDLMQVERPAGADMTAPYSYQLLAAEEALPEATAVSVAEPRSADRATVVSMAMPDGSPRDVFVDPWSGEVLGSLDPDKTLTGTAIRLHANLMSGRAGDLLLELGTSWAIVMALTGYYLFWRGRRARRRQRDSGRPQARLRSRHAALGVVVGVGLLGMVVTGLPWTGVWGAQVQRLVSSQGSSLWSTDDGAVSNPLSTMDESLPHSHGAVPWAQGGTDVPRSQREGSVVDVDTALAAAEREGIRRPVTVVLPTEQSGTFSVIGYAFDDPSKERTVHVDRFGGAVRATYGYDDYPALAKVVAQGIGLHEGRSLGWLSMTTAAAFCVGVIVLCVTGPLMWWRRRPSGAGHTGAPRGRLPLRASPVLAALVVALAVFLPVFGASLVLVLLLDRFVLRRVPALSGFFQTT